jgi:hypothetical protein
LKRRKIKKKKDRGRKMPCYFGAVAVGVEPAVVVAAGLLLCIK